MPLISPLRRKLFIIGGDMSIHNMFIRRGWAITEKIGEADLIQFTGGEDVDPRFYNSKAHAATRFSTIRDLREKVIFDWAQKFAAAEPIPTVGICRGGQFLNVMCGGEMWQHVNGHGGTHRAKDELTDTELMVTSTHHQMMKPPKHAMVLMTAQMATRKEAVDGAGLTTLLTQKYSKASPDIESVYFHGERSLCFQPHPEYSSAQPELQDLYFQYIEDMIFA